MRRLSPLPLLGLSALGLLALFLGFRGGPILAAWPEQSSLQSGAEVLVMLSVCLLAATGLLLPQALLNRLVLGPWNEALSTRALAPALFQVPLNAALALWIRDQAGLFLLSFIVLYVAYQYCYLKLVFPRLTRAPSRVAWFAASTSLYLCMIPLGMVAVATALRLVIAFMKAFGLSLKALS
jgi:hypothetical protein